MEDFKQKRDAFMEEWRQKRRANGILHAFTPMPDSERLSYEFLTPENCAILVNLFGKEDNPFIDTRFKSIAEAQQYALDMSDLRYDAKHGGCDFLIKLKNSFTYIGVLHLFDFSLENFSDVPQRCSIGFAIALPFRRQYYATEAIKQLIQYAHINYHKTKILAYTAIENTVSNTFLQSLNMRLDNEAYIYGGKRDNYYVLNVASDLSEPV